MPTVKNNFLIQKAVLPAAGLGTRFLPATKAQPKEMLPVADKPAIQYIVEEAVEAGLTDIIIVTGRGKRSLEDHFDRSFELEHYLEQAGKFGEMNKIKAIAEMATIHYVRQSKPDGLGNAIKCAAYHVGNNPFCVALADDFIFSTSNHLEILKTTFENLSASILLVKKLPAERITNYGVIKIEKQISEKLFKISSVVEKPSKSSAPSNYAIIGRYAFTPTIFDCIAQTKPGKNGEIQLTDAILKLLEKEPVYALETTELRFDLGDKVEYLLANIKAALNIAELKGPLKEGLTELLDG